MSDGQIKLTIGAVKGSSIARVFADIRRQAMRVGREVAKALDPGATTGARSMATDLERAAKAAKGVNSERLAGAKRVGDQERRNYAERERNERSSLRNNKEITREARRRADEERRASKATRRRIETLSGRFSNRASRFIWPNAPSLSVARRGASEIARGLGVDYTIGGQLSTAMDQEQLAIAISNQAYLKEGERTSPESIIGRMRGIVKRHGTKGGTMGMMRAMMAHVEQLGNISGFFDVADVVSQMTSAYDAEPEDIGKLAGKFDAMLSENAAYKDPEVRKNKIIELLKQSAFVGKKGSIGLSNQAREAPKLTGVAGLVRGDPAEAYMNMLAIAQAAERGPAKDPRIAFTYTQRLMTDLIKQADKFEEAGIRVYDKEMINGVERERMRNPLDIIRDMIIATESTKDIKKRGVGFVSANQQQQIKSLLPNLRSNLAVQNFLSQFYGSGETGVKGADMMMAWTNYLREKPPSGMFSSDVSTHTSSTTAQVNRMNAEFEEVAQNLRKELTPSLIEITPHLKDFAEWLSGAIKWIAQDPITRAVEVAVGAAVARAALESIFRVGAEKAFSAVVATVAKMAGMGGVEMLASKTGAGTLINAATAITVGTASFMVTRAAINLLDKDAENVSGGFHWDDIPEVLRMSAAQNLPEEQQTLPLAFKTLLGMSPSVEEAMANEDGVMFDAEFFASRSAADTDRIVDATKRVAEATASALAEKPLKVEFYGNIPGVDTQDGDPGSFYGR